jgi:ABC-type branched-subunit amino acid transport system permease subunit
MAGAEQMFETSMFIGLGVVAVWTYVRFPRLRPGSLVWAVLHVLVSLGVFVLLPTLLGLMLPLVDSHRQEVYLAIALLIPALTYLLLSWVWLFARVLHDLDRTPRGGHPASDKTA